MPTNILQNKFGGVDQRSLPQKGEDFLEINGVFPRFAGLQNRIEGKLLLDKFNGEIWNIYQAWNPFGYGLGLYQLNNNLLTDTWYPPDFPLPPSISYLIPTDNGLSDGGGGGFPNNPPLPNNPPTVVSSPQNLVIYYIISGGSVWGSYGAGFPGTPPANYGSPDPNLALKVYNCVDVPYSPSTPVFGSPAGLSSFETKTSSTDWLGGWYPEANIRSSGSYISGIFDLHSYLPLRAAVLMGQQTVTRTDGTSITTPQAYSLKVNPITGQAEFLIRSVVLEFHTNIDYVGVAPSSQGFHEGHMDNVYTSLQIYH